MATLTTKDSFTQNLAKMENSVTSMTKLMIILEKKGEERSFDELLIVRTGAREIPCLRAALANLRPDQVDELCRSMMLETFSAGSVVFKQGDVGDKFYGEIYR